MPGFTLNKMINCNQLRLVVLAVLWLASLPEAAAQVLTLDSRECVKVEAKFSELVPHHKYKRPDFLPIMGSNDTPPHDEDGKPIPYEEWRNRKRDTSSTYLEDEITCFYIWHKNEVLRIITRKESDSAIVKSLDHNILLPVASLSGANVHQAYYLINQFQQKSSCTFIGKLFSFYDFYHSDIYDFHCGLLAFTNNSNQVEYYRIFHFTGFSIEPKHDVNGINHAILKPNFIFEMFRYFGFTVEERMKIYVAKPESDTWFDKVKNFFYKLFSTKKYKKIKNNNWLEKMRIIYEKLFYNYKTPDGNKPNLYTIPYLTSKQLEQWPRYFHFSFNREAQKQFIPLYSRNSVKGYYFYDEKLHPETKGYVVVPGKFFLPRRLQIISVNDVPWQE